MPKITVEYGLDIVCNVLTAVKNVTEFSVSVVFPLIENNRYFLRFLFRLILFYLAIKS